MISVKLPERKLPGQVVATFLYLFSSITKNKGKMNRRQPSLIFCLLMDFIGYASYSIPVLGEVTDVIWAPISGLIFFLTFGGWRGALGGMFDFVEELLPGTDFIPSFTLMWFFQKMRAKSSQSTIKYSR